MMNQNLLDLNGKSLLITGGTGSFGKKFVEIVLNRYPGIKRLVVYSRDELKQYEMSITFPIDKYKCLRYFIGDVRDKDRFKRACESIDYIVHAAALKQVPTAEYNPMEFIKTNILGAENVIEVALDMNIKKVIALSTDKAAAPINLYGATKLCSDKLFIAANNMKGPRDITFSVVRYGNVIGSRGSVIPFFLEKRKEGLLPLTDIEMTRFSISLEEGIDLVLFALANAIGKEIFVPKIPSYRIIDVAKAIGPECRIVDIGIRPGEKIHEEMITKSDSFYTIDAGKYFIILPPLSKEQLGKYMEYYRAVPVEKGFSYSSGTNDQWLSIEDIRGEIRKHVDANFTTE
jgi:UDP-N-acetylglucosamine 4,6-dehydratase (inverting)